MHSALTITTDDGPAGTRLVALAGEADMDTAVLLNAHLHAALTRSPLPRTLDIDCSRLAFCTSSGLNEFLRARRSAAAQGTELRIVHPSRQLLRVLRITEADTVVTVVTAPVPGRTPAGPAPTSHG
ncbi:STAS domain-containing protein [Kitasatospora purpeofusca]|uniref:STAS domain-containing protein n=1 Tax=Kitasatospora purpeofusca TaxID=67352 RepID=UPI0036CCEE78